MVRVFLRKLRKSIVGEETVCGESDPYMRVGQYLWHTVQSQRVMTDFREAYFHWQTSIAPNVVNKLFTHRDAKFDVDVLRVKTWEHNDIPKKQEKYTKPMKSTFDYFQDKLKVKQIKTRVWKGPTKVIRSQTPIHK